MAKINLEKPILICLYGYPGSGKSFLARNLAKEMKIAHISSDKIRSELFASPRHSSQENAIVLHLMEYMASEFLASGLSVIFDINALRISQRKKLRELATKNNAQCLMVWIQVDADTSFARTQRRDKRLADDRFAQPHTRQSFDNYIAHMQNPQDEPYLVVSGKHSFSSQKSAVTNKLFQLGLIPSSTVQQTITRPDLVNLVPNYRPINSDSRNISIY